MKVKTFTGATIDEALTAVKNDMGNSVLILETRTRPENGTRGRKLIEVIVADDDDGEASADPSTTVGVSRKRRRETTKVGGAREIYRAGTTPAPTLIPAETPKTIPAHSTGHGGNGNGNGKSRPGNLVESSRTPTPATSMLASVPSAQVPALVQRVSDVNMRGGMVTPAFTGPNPPSKVHAARQYAAVDTAPAHQNETPQPGPNIYQAFYEHLLEQDMPEGMAKSIVEQVFYECGPRASFKELAASLKAALAERIQVAPIPVLRNTRETRIVQSSDEIDDLLRQIEANEGDTRAEETSSPFMAAFAGPPGAGKTTALAKVAAYFANRKMRSVGLLAIDAGQARAVRAIDFYGKSMGVKTRRVRTPAQLAQAVQEFSHCTYIFIDTPACTVMNREQNGHPTTECTIEKLRNLLEVIPGMDVHLVLNATTRLNDLRAMVKAFLPLGVNRLLFTHLDETEALGHLLALANETGLPISYLTTGLGIPNDLESATPDALVERVLM